MPDLTVLERGRRAAAHIALAQPNDETDDDGPFHQPLAVLRSGREMLIDMYRMLVHTQQAEQRIVKLGDGAARPMAKRLARFQVFEIAPVFGGDQAIEDNTN